MTVAVATTAQVFLAFVEQVLLPALRKRPAGWAVMKAKLRRAEARSLDQLDAALPHALDQITSSRAQGWFRHAGYRSY